MLYLIHCPSCGHKVEVDARLAGRIAACPRCDGDIEIPLREIGPDCIVGGFLIQSLIGKGAMGEVYLARQLSMDREVALKILPRQLTLDAELVQKFMNEVRMSARMEHPNIITAYEAGEDHGIYYLAMAYIRGESLLKRLARGGPLPEPEALAIAAKIARALNYAWNEHRVLHRDIKPENIVMDSNGEPRLLDLGLSMALSEAASQRGDSPLEGTPNYMSPEVITGEGAVDQRSDIYSLGATLYQMVTATVPFDGASVDDILRRQTGDLLQDPRDINPAVSPGCVKMLARMLAKRPEDRFASWPDLLGEFERLLSPPSHAPRPLFHPTPRPPHQAAAPSASRPLGGLLIAGFVIAILVGLFAVRREVPTPAPPAQPTPPPSAPAPPPEPVAPTPLPATPPAEGQWADLHHLIREARTNPLNPQLPDRFRDLASRVRGTELEREAEHAERNFLRQRQAALDAHFKSTAEEALRIAGRGQGGLVLDQIREGVGSFGLLAAEQREELAGQVKERMARLEQETRKKAKQQLTNAFEAEITTAAKALLAREIALARTHLMLTRLDPAYQGMEAKAQAYEEALQEASRLQEVLLQSFQGQLGQTVELPLADRTETCRILAVRNGLIEVDIERRLGSGVAASTFAQLKLSSLNFRERQARIERLNPPGKDLLLGLLAFECGQAELARTHFQASPSPLAPHLLAAMDPGK